MDEGRLNETHIIPSGIALAIFAPFVFVLDLPPLIWHVRNRNTAAICMVSWIMLLNLISTLNLIIWPYTTDTMWLGEGFCDIETKLLVGKATGVPAATMCLIRALAEVIDTDKAVLSPTRAQRRRRLIVDLLWCVGLPVLTMILHYVVQWNRYILAGVTGCGPTIAANWTSLFLMSLPPVLLSLAAAYYASLVLIRLRRYRHTFGTILASNNSTKSRFFRLFTIALLLTFVSLPLQLYILSGNIPSGNDPQTFSKIHNSEIWDVVYVENSLVKYPSWISVGIGFCIFFLFGLGRDAKEMYRGWLVSLGLGNCFPWLLQTNSHQGTGSERSSRPELFARSRNASAGWSKTAIRSNDSLELISPQKPQFIATEERSLSLARPPSALAR